MNSSQTQGGWGMRARSLRKLSTAVAWMSPYTLLAEARYQKTMKTSQLISCLLTPLALVLLALFLLCPPLIPTRKHTQPSRLDALVLPLLSLLTRCRKGRQGDRPRGWTCDRVPRLRLETFAPVDRQAGDERRMVEDAFCRTAAVYRDLDRSEGWRRGWGGEGERVRDGEEGLGRVALDLRRRVAGRQGGLDLG